MAPKDALPTHLWSSKWGPTSFNDVKINGATQWPSVLNSPLTTGGQECTVVQTSAFAGRIHSLSLSPTSSRIAIAYGNEITLTDVISNPSRLKVNQEYLPRPPASPQGTKKLGEPIAKTLHFMRKRDHLVVTYAAHGIACALSESLWIVLSCAH